MGSRIQFGNLLVEAGVISAKTLERSLALQRGSGKRLGALLTEMGLVTEEEVCEALARQCNTRSVRNFSGKAFPKELLDLIPAGMALEKLVFPLKQNRNMLAVAAFDPFDNATFKALAETTGMAIHIVLATRSDILAAVVHHYRVQVPALNSRRTILLLDPSPVVTMYLQAPLERDGYDVCISHDGVAGLKLARSRRPDLVLCDLMIPGLDSYALLYALKADPATATVPVILMSSKDTAEEEHRAHKAGFVDFIAKPAMPVRVLGAVRKALATGGKRTQAVPGPASSPQLKSVQVQGPENLPGMQQGML